MNPFDMNWYERRWCEGSALLLAFYFLMLCFEEVLKHETSLKVRYRVMSCCIIEVVEDNLEELFG